MGGPLDKIKSLFGQDSQIECVYAGPEQMSRGAWVRPGEDGESEDAGQGVGYPGSFVVRSGEPDEADGGEDEGGGSGRSGKGGEDGAGTVRFCQMCGAKQSEGARFCPECGAKTAREVAHVACVYAGPEQMGRLEDRC